VVIGVGLVAGPGLKMNDDVLYNGILLGVGKHPFLAFHGGPFGCGSRR